MGRVQDRRARRCACARQTRLQYVLMTIAHACSRHDVEAKTNIHAPQTLGTSTHMIAHTHTHTHNYTQRALVWFKSSHRDNSAVPKSLPTSTNTHPNRCLRGPPSVAEQDQMDTEVDRRIHKRVERNIRSDECSSSTRPPFTYYRVQISNTPSKK